MNLPRKQWTRLLAGGFAVFVLLLGLAWGWQQTTGVAFAQSAQPQAQPTPPQGPKPGNPPTGAMGGWRAPGHMNRGGPAGWAAMGGRYANNNALLANALGITQEELQNAYRTVAEKALDQAVTAGKLTQAQADQLKSRLSNLGVMGMMGMAPRFLGDVDVDTLLAGALGISVDELNAARDNMIQKGVDAGLLTQAQGNDLLVQQMIRDAKEQAVRDALQQAVEKGLLTQAQADAMLNRQGVAMMGGFGGSGPFGGRGVPGFRHHAFPRQRGPNAPQAPAPEATPTPSSS